MIFSPTSVKMHGRQRCLDCRALLHHGQMIEFHGSFSILLKLSVRTTPSRLTSLCPAKVFAKRERLPVSSNPFNENKDVAKSFRWCHASQTVSFRRGVQL